MRAYYYLFYKLYNFWEKISFPKFWSDFKAGISIIVIEIWLMFSIINYYSLYNNVKLNVSLKSPNILLPILLIISTNIYFFNIRDNWKTYNEQFDNLPKWKNILGGIVIWIIIVLIIASYFLSSYYMQKIVLGM